MFISIQHDTYLQTEKNKTIKYRTFDDFSIRKFNSASSNSLVSLLEGVFDPKIAFTRFHISSKGRIDRNIYTQFRNLLTKQIRDAKGTYFNNQFDKCKNDIRKTWKIINSNTRKKKQKK